MSVNSVSGAAPLPLPAAGSTSSGAAGTPAGTASSGEVRLPGVQHAPEDSVARQARVAKEERLKEAARPVSPPLKGLTVAEIRAMLGVPPLPGQTGGAAVPPTTTSASQTYLRYA